MSANPFVNPNSYFNLRKEYLAKCKQLPKADLPVNRPGEHFKTPNDKDLLLQVIQAYKKENVNQKHNFVPLAEASVGSVIRLITQDEQISDFLIADYMTFLKTFSNQNPTLNCEIIEFPIDLKNPKLNDFERATESDYAISICYSSAHFVTLVTFKDHHYIFDSLPNHLPNSTYSDLPYEFTILSPLIQNDLSSCGPIALMMAKIILLSEFPYKHKQFIYGFQKTEVKLSISNTFNKIRINLFRDFLLTKLNLPTSYGFNEYPELEEEKSEEEQEEEEESLPPSRSPSRSPSPPPPPPPKKEKKRKILPALERAKTLASISSPQGPKQPPKPKRGKKQAEPPIYLENVPTFPVRLNIPKFVAFEKDNGKFQVVPTTTKTGALTTRQKQKSIVITNDETKEPSVFVGRNDIYSNEFVPSSKKKAIEFYG